MKTPSTGRNFGLRHLAALLVLVIFTSGAFLAGVQYQKDRTKSAANPPAVTGGQFGTPGFGRRFGGQRPSVGAVTSVSSSSITIQERRSGSSLTFSITSTTAITNNGQTASANDIHNGDTVAIIASTSNSKEAARILLNAVSPAATNSVPNTSTQ